MTTRRGFLGSILAAAVAPAIVRADSLMRIVPRETTILPADASVLRLVPAQGELLIQWVGDEPDGFMRAQQYPSGAGGHYTVPEGVQAVWLTMLAGGGGGGGGARNYGGGGAGGAVPMVVKPGQIFVFQTS